MGSSGVLLGSLGGFSGAKEPSWAPLGCSWGSLGGLLGSSGVLWGVFWGLLSSLGVVFGALGSLLGAILTLFRTILSSQDDLPNLKNLDFS